MRSKEGQVIELFFEQPTREWHFEEVLREAKITRSKAVAWLRKLGRERIVRKVKERGRMPYYTAAYDSPAYRNRKRLFALGKLYESGLLDHLGSLPKAEAVIIFGSFARSDWHEGSDIDVFIYGSPEGLKIAGYEVKLHRDLQLFICRTKGELARFGKGFVRNVIKGNLIKGNLDFVEVGINA